MSWESAQEAAGQWLGNLHVGRDLYRQDIDLTHAPLEYEGRFREMVLESVKRKLIKRGARSVALPPPVIVDPE